MIIRPKKEELIQAVELKYYSDSRKYNLYVRSLF